MRFFEKKYPVSRMCAILGVSRSGYYDWKKSPVSQRELKNKELLRQIDEIFIDSKKRYGSPKITKILAEQGITCGHNRVARLMWQAGMRSKVVKKFRPTASVIDKKDAVENILDRNFFWEKPNQAWVTDITYIPTSNGWVYLCVFLDLCTRCIVGWEVSENMKTELVLSALRKACRNKNPQKDLIIHSDQGSQFGSNAYKKFLKDRVFIQSMSRRGNCWDNACVESFFRVLKAEEINGKKFNDVNDVRYSLFCYIDHFYNRKRIHGTLGYKSPAEFEKLIFA